MRQLSAVILTLSVVTGANYAQARSANTSYDASLKQQADALLPLLERVTAHHPHIQPFYDSDKDPYLARLRQVLRQHRTAHPSSHIRVAVSLFSGHMDLTTETSDKWDFLIEPELFGKPEFNTITYGVNSKTTTYRIYSTPFALPGSFQREGFKSSLSVFVPVA